MWQIVLGVSLGWYLSLNRFLLKIQPVPSPQAAGGNSPGTPQSFSSSPLQGSPTLLWFFFSFSKNIWEMIYQDISSLWRAGLGSRCGF